MSPVIKRLLVAPIVALAVIAAVVFVGPLLVPTDIVKGWIATAVHDRTGRELRIAGPLRLSLLPRPGFAAYDVSLSNPAGGFTTDFFHADTVDVTLRPIALLEGIVAIDQIALAHPAINFEIDKDGRRNWVFHRAEKSAPQASSAPDNAPSLLSGAVALSGGTLSYLDQRGGKKYVATGVDVAVSLPGLTGPLRAVGTITYNGENIRLALAIATPQNLRKDIPSDATLNLTSARGTLDFLGKIGDSRSTKASGSVELKAPALRDLLVWAGVAAAKNRGVLGSLSIAGQVEIAGSRIRLDDTSVKLDGIAATGNLTVERGGERPALVGNLDIDQLDLNPFFEKPNEPTVTAVSPGSGAPAAPPGPPTAPPPIAPAAAAPEPKWNTTAIDLSPLKLVDADLHLSVNALRLGHVEIGKSTFALRLKAGRLDLDLSGMTLYGGKGGGKFVIDDSGNSPAFGARLNLTGITVTEMPVGIAGFDSLSGSGGVNVEVIGHGATLRDVVASLNGVAGANFSDGSIASAGLTPALQNSLGPMVGGSSIPREISYRSLSGTATIAYGSLRNDDLTLRGPKMSATAAGELNLPQCGIDYLWLPDIPGLGSARVTIGGAWDAPTYKVLSVTITKGLMGPRPKPARH